MDVTKPFTISKELVMRAFKEVKANAGAAGVDGESIDVRRQLNLSDVVRKLLSPTGESRGHSQKEWWGKNSGSADCV